MGNGYFRHFNHTRRFHLSINLMKIVLPKSLTEPLTIGWPEPYDHEKILGGIIAVLAEEFQELDDARLLPSSETGMTIAQTCDHMRWLAERRGMEDISTTCMNIHRGGKTWVGYLFTVRFSEPGKTKRHNVDLKTYF